jgi:UrcA family protein
MNHSLTRAIRITLLSTTLAVFASRAVAADERLDAPHPPVTVRFGDLNTSTEAGSKALYARVRQAASKACRSGGAEWYPTQSWAFEDCYRATLDRTVARLNVPKLTAMHLASKQSTASPKPGLRAGSR